MQRYLLVIASLSRVNSSAPHHDRESMLSLNFLLRLSRETVVLEKRPTISRVMPYEEKTMLKASKMKMLLAPLL